MSHHEEKAKVEYLNPDEVGYFGRALDRTPNEHYTVAGVLADKPVPETQPLDEGDLPPLARHHGVEPVSEDDARAEARKKARQEQAAAGESD